MLMLLYIKGFPFYTQNNPVIYSGCAYVELLYKNEFVLYALVYLVLYFLAGMLLAGIGAAVSAFASNKYVVLAAPYMVYRIYMEFAKGMKIPDIFRLDFIFSGRVQPLGTATSLVLAAAITIALLTVCTVIFAAGVKRRLENVR